MRIPALSTTTQQTYCQTCLDTNMTTAFAPALFTPRFLPALLVAFSLWASPAAAGDVAVSDADAETAAPVIMLDSDGSAVSASEGDLLIMPDGTMMPAADALDTAEAEGHAEESKGGFPQLDTSTYSSQVFWLAVSFILLYVLMSRMALPRVTEVLDMRQTQLNVNLDRAAQLSDEAQKAKDAFETILAEAQETARTAIATTEQKAAERANADSARFAEHARERVATAETNIAKAKADALNSLADIAAEVAADMANKVAKTHLTKADAMAAVKAQMGKAA